MNTIDAFAGDIELQLDFLDGFKPQKPQMPGKMVFCGSGDSLCAGMLAEAFSDYHCKAIDPLEVLNNKKIILGKDAYFVSVSGNTISNVRASRLGKNTVAITRNAQSRLAKSCKNVIQLDYSDSQVLTSGSIGFLSSALTCVSLVCGLRIKDAGKMFRSAKAQSKRIILRNKVYFLGNQHTYPIAMYATAKLGEVLGMDSHYERIEQFSHMGLFSAKKGDTVVIFADATPHTKRLVAHLAKLGLHVYNPNVRSNKIGLVLFYTFVSQFVALNAARKKRIKDCYFVTQKKLRAASSDMIY